MALSGQYFLTLTFEDICQEVLEILQVIGDGETVTTSMRNKIKTSTNLLIKKWDGLSINLWTYTEGTLFLQVGQAEYDLRDSSTRVTNQFFETKLSADALAGATSITVVDADNIQDTDSIGIITGNNNLFWTTVNGAPVGNTITLAAGLDADAINGAVVYNYRATDIIPVQRVLNVRRRESTDYEIPIIFESRTDYFDLPNKNQLGFPIQAYYSRQEPQGIFYIWNSPSSSVPVINFTYERPKQTIVNDTDNIDIPEYFYDAFIMNICRTVMYKFATDPQKRAEIKADADEYLNEVLAFDNAVYPIEVKVQQYG